MTVTPSQLNVKDKESSSSSLFDGKCHLILYVPHHRPACFIFTKNRGPRYPASEECISADPLTEY